MHNLNDIRTLFLDYFQKRDHVRVSSSSLVPQNDPTLLFTNSGMVQFKNIFTGIEKRDYARAVTAQKCVRAGGKHNDLDNVGYTKRHHTFFEMLGNFSFGDYFKEKAIYFAWEFITRELKIPKNRLYITVFHNDDEAIEFWRKIAGLNDDRIIRISSNDNFWSMGPVGPCGPCSEIFYDHGEHIWGGLPGSATEDNDRFVEIWNLVFMQYERCEDGNLIPLPCPSVDTGMGIERVSALLRGSNDNYETDMLRRIIEYSAELTACDPDGRGAVHHRVVADHLRASAFLIADGVMPSNDGRGYVLRRIMRRALRHLHLLGTSDPIFHKLLPVLIDKMGGAYPELGKAFTLIDDTLKQEELRFKKMLERGLKLLDVETEKLEKGKMLSGKVAFKLYDTYGFPLDLTQDALREKNLEVDSNAFDIEMAEQKRKARAAWKGSGYVAETEKWFDFAEKYGSTEFLGYEQQQTSAQALALISDGKEYSQIDIPNMVFQLITNQTVFYAESGGQVGDKGKIFGKNVVLEITDTQRMLGLNVHMARLVSGEIKKGDSLTLEIDHMHRLATCINHSATHLLNEALRQILGAHVIQRGSLNAPGRLRFDFSHNAALDFEQIRKIEREVNFYIRQNSAVETRIMALDVAQKIGAQALFGEKYEEEVRVVSMGQLQNSGKGHDGRVYSLELCGGTHVSHTGDIGAFIIQSDAASSAGVRRIEALTGDDVLDYMRVRDDVLNAVAAKLKTPIDDIVQRVDILLNERKNLLNEIENLRKATVIGGKNGQGQVLKTKKIGHIDFVSGILSRAQGKDLLEVIDAQKSALANAVILVISKNEKKAILALGVTKELSRKINAKEFIITAVEALGGTGGGGRPDLAQGGAPNVQDVEKAIKAVEAQLTDFMVQNEK